MKTTRKVGLIALVASTYAMVAGGPFGLEEIIQNNGYRGALLIICITPLLWALPTTLMVSELASAMPETGGFFVWVRRALGPFWGFQESWLTFVGSIFDMAIYPILFSSYLAHLVPALGRGKIPFCMGALMIGSCVAMNLLGTGFVGRGSVVFVLALLAPFGLLVWYGFASAPAAAAHPALTNTDLLGGVLIAMWNYMGWDNASLIAGDVENARRTYTRAMAIALIVVVLTYVLPIAAVAHAGISPSAWETGAWVTFARLLGGKKLAILMTLAGGVAALSTFNALVMSLTRLPYAMARDGSLPQVFTRENRRGAPWVAIIVCAIFWTLATIMGFEATVMLDVLMTGLSILLEFAALIALRVRQPDLPRTFRVPGGVAGVVLLSVPPTVLIAISCARNHAERVGRVNAFTIGVALVMLGVGFYFLGRRPSRSCVYSSPMSHYLEFSRSLGEASTWLWRKLATWSGVLIFAPLLWTVGLTAMYGNDFIIARVFYCAGILWIVVRAITSEEVKAHNQRDWIVVLVCLVGVVGLWGSLAWVNAKHRIHEAEDRNQKKTFINITIPNGPIWDSEPSKIPVVLLNLQYRNSGSFPANRFAILGNLYLFDERSDTSEDRAANEFKSYVNEMKSQYPKDSITLGPGERTIQTVFRLFSPILPFHPTNLQEVFAQHVIYAVAMAGYYDDNGYYHESHVCSSIAWNSIVGFPQRPCKLYGDQF